jgi:methylenetetrahydrofolate--tRNA-(uracil-5-)-methyltransferase
MASNTDSRLNISQVLRADGTAPVVHVVGGGLAGSECAWQLAERGIKVVLIEMRGARMTPAHKTDRLAELVCSNSFGSQTDYSAPGQLKWEAEKLNSLILKAAKESTIPAGMALGVDRERFAQFVTDTLSKHPNIQIERRVIQSLDEVPRPAVIATGPLTDEPLALSIRDHLSYGEVENDFLYFFDAIAPVIDTDSIDMKIAWRGDRFDRGTNDYLNCPFHKDQYFQFIEAIKAARKVEPKDFEKIPYFEGCMPIEVMVERGPLTPKFGPMSPNGLRDPNTGERPFAVVQLRQENKEGTAYNMVGFQTKMAYGDQKEVFRMIPGLENAEFLKLGSIHKNMYIHSPRKLTPMLSSRRDPYLYFAGQITGVEGYFDSTCIGLLVARFLSDQLQGREISLPPRESAMGSLLNAITEYKEHFQPTNMSFGLFPQIELQIRNQQDRELKRTRQLENAKSALIKWL